MSKIKLPKTKIVPFGANENQRFSIRTMGNKVRMQDHETGNLYILPPPIARALADCLKYASKHAEVQTVPIAQDPLFTTEIVKAQKI